MIQSITSPHSSHRIQEVVQVERIIREDICRGFVDGDADDCCVLDEAENKYTYVHLIVIVKM